MNEPVQTLGLRWAALAPRERTGVVVAGTALAVLAVWFVLLRPAITTLRDAPRQLDVAEAELQQLQRLAAEAERLRALPGVEPQRAAEALQAATTQLGGAGRLSILGDRATLTLNAVGTEALGDWLADARSAARARVVEAQLTRAGNGWSGTLGVQFGSAP